MSNQCSVNETLIIQTAQFMKDYGLLVRLLGPNHLKNKFIILQDVGYNHVNLDDCWASKNRSSTGEVLSGQFVFAA
jgi:alpha-galactosidase